MSVRNEIVRITRDLIAIRSVSDNLTACHAVIDYVEAFCRDLPGVVTRRIESAGVPSLVAAFDDRKHKALVLNAHLDVVPARDEQWTPIERDGRIYGRGAQDMKGAGAAMLVLLRALATAGRRPNVAFQFVTDEEVSGEHGVGFLVNDGWTADFFIAGEPTDLEIVNQAKGILWTTVSLAGQPAHGSRPWDGRNPLLPIAQGITALLESYPVPEEPVWRTTATPAALHSGDAHNRVPADAELRLDIRYVPEDNPATILARVRSYFPDATVEAHHCGSVLNTSAEDSHVQRLISAARTVLGQEPAFRSEHFGSDARFYGEKQTPAVCFGPIGAGLHSHDEWVDIESLETFYRVLERLVAMYEA